MFTYRLCADYNCYWRKGTSSFSYIISVKHYFIIICKIIVLWTLIPHGNSFIFCTSIPSLLVDYASLNLGLDLLRFLKIYSNATTIGTVSRLCIQLLLDSIIDKSSSKTLSPFRTSSHQKRRKRPKTTDHITAIDGQNFTSLTFHLLIIEERVIVGAFTVHSLVLGDWKSQKHWLLCDAYSVVFLRFLGSFVSHWSCWGASGGCYQVDISKPTLKYQAFMYPPEIWFINELSQNNTFSNSMSTAVIASARLGNPVVSRKCDRRPSS